MTDSPDTIAARIRVRLAEHGWSQHHLSEVAGLGALDLSRRMTGRTDWRSRELYAIAGALDLSLIELLPPSP